MKILHLFLCCVCIIGCASYGDDDEGIRGTFGDATDVEHQTAATDSVDATVENPDACLPDLHGEHITGELRTRLSETRNIRINRDYLTYFYTLGLMLNDSTIINIVPEKAILSSRNNPGVEPRLKNGDLLLVKLDRVLEPGVWKGALVKNLTRNISF